MEKLLFFRLLGVQDCSRVNNVNIRTSPSTGYESIGKVPHGVPLAMTDKLGNWYQIDYNGRTAYIIEDYVVRN